MRRGALFVDGRKVKTFIVGERGPELFVPSKDGLIIPPPLSRWQRFLRWLGVR